MPLAQDDYVVQALAADRSDQPFSEAVLPGRSWCNRLVVDTHGDDRDNVQDRWKPAIKLDEEQTVAVRELNPTAHLAAQHDQLMPEHHILGFKPALRLDGRHQDREYKPE